MFFFFSGENSKKHSHVRVGTCLGKVGRPHRKKLMTAFVQSGGENVKIRGKQVTYCTTPSGRLQPMFIEICSPISQPQTVVVLQHFLCTIHIAQKCIPFHSFLDGTVGHLAGVSNLSNFLWSDYVVTVTVQNSNICENEDSWKISTSQKGNICNYNVKKFGEPT